MLAHDARSHECAPRPVTSRAHLLFQTCPTHLGSHLLSHITAGDQAVRWCLSSGLLAWWNRIVYVTVSSQAWSTASILHKELFSLGFIELLVASSDYIFQRMSRQFHTIAASESSTRCAQRGNLNTQPCLTCCQFWGHFHHVRNCLAQSFFSSQQL